MIHDERLLGIVALDPAAQAAVDWAALSPVAQRARKLAHGSPALLWLDLPLDGTRRRRLQGAAEGQARGAAAPAPTAHRRPAPAAAKPAPRFARRLSAVLRASRRRDLPLAIFDID